MDKGERVSFHDFEARRLVHKEFVSVRTPQCYFAVKSARTSS